MALILPSPAFADASPGNSHNRFRPKECARRWQVRAPVSDGNRKTVDEVQIARSTAAGAHRKRARYVRLGARSERGHLLVPDVHPLDLALPTKGVGQTVQTIADDSVYALDAGHGESVCELICNGVHDHLLCQCMPGGHC